MATLGRETRDYVNCCHDLVMSLLDKLAVKKNEVFTIADYGTNDGFASFSLIESMTEVLRKKHGDDLTIQVIYEDQEQNDFNSLFKRLTDGSTYMSKFAKVYPFATNINFYKQCVPENTCDVIFTSFTCHWMETLDMTFEDCTFGLLGTKEERARLSVEGERNWTTFLQLRARELKPGGILVALNLCDADTTGEGIKYWITADDFGENSATDLTVPPEIDVIKDLDSAWKDLKERKAITEEEYKRCTFKHIFRTAKEFTSPFQNETSAVRQAGLTLVHFDQFVRPCLLKKQWLERRAKGIDSKKNTSLFVDGLVSIHRVWSQSTFHGALSDKLIEEDKIAILDQLYKAFQKRVKNRDIESYKTDNLMSRLVARKTQ